MALILSNQLTNAVSYVNAANAKFAINVVRVVVHQCDGRGSVQCKRDEREFTGIHIMLCLFKCTPTLYSSSIAGSRLVTFF
jgi:hypothetical protein